MGYGNDSIDLSSIKALQTTLADNYSLSIITLLPALVVVGAAVMKMPAIPTVLSGVVVASLVAFLCKALGSVRFLRSSKTASSAKLGLRLLISYCQRRRDVDDLGNHFNHFCLGLHWFP